MVTAFKLNQITDIGALWVRITGTVYTSVCNEARRNFRFFLSKLKNALAKKIDDDTPLTKSAQKVLMS